MKRDLFSVPKRAPFIGSHAGVEVVFAETKYRDALTTLSWRLGLTYILLAIC
jgi:hypothetical protein